MASKKIENVGDLKQVCVAREVRVPRLKNQIVIKRATISENCTLILSSLCPGYITTAEFTEEDIIIEGHLTMEDNMVINAAHGSGGFGSIDDFYKSGKCFKFPLKGDELAFMMIVQGSNPRIGFYNDEGEAVEYGSSLICKLFKWLFILCVLLLGVFAAYYWKTGGVDIAKTFDGSVFGEAKKHFTDKTIDDIFK